MKTIFAVGAAVVLVISTSSLARAQGGPDGGCVVAQNSGAAQKAGEGEGDRHAVQQAGAAAPCKP